MNEQSSLCLKVKWVLSSVDVTQCESRRIVFFLEIHKVKVEKCITYSLFQYFTLNYFMIVFAPFFSVNYIYYLHLNLHTFPA